MTPSVLNHKGWKDRSAFSPYPRPTDCAAGYNVPYILCPQRPSLNHLSSLPQGRRPIETHDRRTRGNAVSRQHEKVAHDLCSEAVNRLEGSWLVLLHVICLAPIPAGPRNLHLSRNDAKLAQTKGLQQPLAYIPSAGTRLSSKRKPTRRRPQWSSNRPTAAIEHESFRPHIGGNRSSEQLFAGSKCPEDSSMNISIHRGDHDTR